MKDWHSLSSDTLEHELGSNLDNGLTQQEAEHRLVSSGPNELPEAPPPSPLEILLAQFSNLIIWVLIGAAAVSGLLQEWVDAGAILAIVILNAILGFVQEFRAEQSLAALKKLSVATARVIRDGVLRSIPARELVPGDLVQIEAGDRIPTDSRLIYATSLQTQEASLTGESTPIAKSAEPIQQTNLPLGDRHNMLFMGTIAVSGKGRALVTETGTHTELGKIAALLHQEAQAEKEETPLQRRLEGLGRALLWLSLAIVVVVFLLGALRGVPLVMMFLTAVSLAVAAIPEGLPAVVTITLALGVTRMVGRHALIRRLPAVETLGSTTVICSDKTGTLTKNEMTVTTLYQGGEAFTVTGEGYAPEGEIRSDGHPTILALQPGLTALVRAAVLCNGAELQLEALQWKIVGDPTEGALLVVAGKAGLSKRHLEQENPWLGEAPFDAERKKMTVVRQTSSGPVAFVKGAPDVLLRDCRTWMTPDARIEPLTEAIRQEILAVNQGLASQALRVLGIAQRLLDRLPDAYGASSLEHDLIFLGLAGMKDPIRPEVKAAVEACRTAGIRTVMITGDHKDTAVAIAQELGIMGSAGQAITGAELDKLTEQELRERVANIAVYARVSAEHKLRVVHAWKDQGAVVAMTGDGVNDAPALKAADIGVAMGITGTDVSKEAADMVVTDDNFASIAAAVEEGRGIYDNIRKSVHYLLSCNISEILVMFLAALFALPLPLLPVQILWINLVTDGLPALALAVDPKDSDLMQRPPRSPDERFLTTHRLMLMLAQGTFLAVTAMFAFVYCLYGMDLNVDRARTLTFTIMVIAQLFHAFNCRSDQQSLFRIGVGTNKALLWATGGSMLLQALILVHPVSREIFKTESFTPEHWALALGCGVLPLIAMECWKALRYARVKARLILVAGGCVLVLAGMGLAGCSREDSQVPEAKPAAPGVNSGLIRLTPEEVQQGGIDVRPVVRGEFRVHREFPATVQPNENELAEVTTLVRGRVVDVYVDVGHDVKKGTPLTKLHSTELGLAESAYLKASAKLHEADLAYERARDLYQHKAISQAELQRREAEHRTAQAEAREAQNRLELLGVQSPELQRLDREHTIKADVSLRAPFDGRVIMRNITRGEVVETAQKLFTVADLSRVWVVGNVPEKDVRFIHKDQTVEVMAAAYPQAVFPGRITYISDVLDPATRTMRLRVTVENPERKLKPEMFATVRVYSHPRPDVLSVPLAAVQNGPAGKIVFVQRQADTFEMRTVKLAEESGEVVVVLDGLHEGEQVVTRGSFVLKSEIEHRKIEPVP